MYKLLSVATLFFTAIAVADAQRFIHPTYRPDNGRPPIIHPTYRPDGGRPPIIHPTYRVPPTEPKTYRFRRFTDRLNMGPLANNGNPNIPSTNGGWQVRPDVSRDQRGNVKSRVDVTNHGKSHDLEAGWEQTVRGPQKHSETWHVGGTYRFPN